VEEQDEDEAAYTSDPEQSFEAEDPVPQDPDLMQPMGEQEPTPPDEFDVLGDLFSEPFTVLVTNPADTSKPATPISVLPPNASNEQLQEALKSKKPTCAGITASYSCGTHDAAPQYSGSIISVAAGDDIAMNSLVLSVVNIDGSGNGEGLIKIPMMNNIKLGVTLSGIKVAEGGCIVAGRAELSGVDASILTARQREQLAKAYAAFNKATDYGIANAGQIAGDINKTMAAIKSLSDKLNEKKRNTQAILAATDAENLTEALTACTEIDAESRALQDSLASLICKVKAGTLKADKSKLEAAQAQNKAFMDKLGPTLAECQSKTFTPWAEVPCKGPCGESVQEYAINPDCAFKLAVIMNADLNSYSPEFISITDPNGGNQTIPKQAIPIINSKGTCQAFIYEEKVYQWQCCQNMGYFEVGQTPSQYTSHTFILEDIYYKKTEPFSWAMKKALVDAGRSFLDFGKDPINNNPVVGIVNLLKQVPNISIDGTIKYLSSLDKDDAYYVSASMILASIGTGGIKVDKAKSIYQRLKSLSNLPINASNLVKLCFSKPESCGNIQHFEDFVTKNLDQLLTTSGRKEIWKMIDGGFRGRIIEYIFKKTKYKTAKDLNAIKNNFPGADFDAINGIGNDLISLKSLGNSTMALLKKTLREHAKALAEANLADLSKIAKYDLKGHNKVLEAVVQKGKWDLGVIDTYKKSLVLEFSKKGINLDIKIREF
jgi:hypothetical protein